VDEQRGKMRLRLDIALVGRPLQPAHALHPARRHAGGLEIAPPHAVLGFRDAGSRRPRQQREGLLDVAALGQAERPAQRGARRYPGHQMVEHCHRSGLGHAVRRQSGGACAHHGSRIASVTTGSTLPIR
jgi:hypothetical protein